MNEKFDFEKTVDFIENELFKENIGYWSLVLKDVRDFVNLMIAVELGFSLPQYKYLVNNFFSEIEKISNKSIEKIIGLNRTIPVTEVLNQYDLKKLRNKLIILGTDYPVKKSQYDLNLKKIAKLNNKLRNLQYQGKILSAKEYEYIEQYCESIVKNSETEKINYVCSLIFNSPNGIDRTLVDYLLKLAFLFQHPEVMEAEPIPKSELGEKEKEH